MNYVGLKQVPTLNAERPMLRKVVTTSKTTYSRIRAVPWSSESLGGSPLQRIDIVDDRALCPAIATVGIQVYRGGEAAVHSSAW